MYKQKDIILIPFPYSDLTGFKQRPALIISNQKINKTQDRICCLITSNQIKEGLEVNNDSLKDGSLPFRSWVKPQRLFTIHEKIIRKKLCTITDDFHDIIINVINTYVNRDKK